MRKTWGVAALVGLTAALAAGQARADDNDLVMSRLGTVEQDGTGAAVDVVGQNQDFRSLASELGVVLAPRLLTPADTLGFGGFQFAVDFGVTSITNDAYYWRALEGSNQPDNPDAVHGEGLQQTVGFFVRKGIWLPTPSFEIGAGAVHLVDSRIWAAQGYAKLALHEGFHDLPIPSVAARGAASRMMGSTDLDLTVASFDVSMSKHFGVANSVGLDPYAGWNLLIIIPRSEVIDKTPHIDSLVVPGDNDMNFVFRDQDDIIRHKLFFGLKAQYYVFQLTFEAGFALAGSSIDDRSGTDARCSEVDPLSADRCDAEDQSELQESYMLSLGMDF